MENLYFAEWKPIVVCKRELTEKDHSQFWLKSLFKCRKLFLLIILLYILHIWCKSLFFLKISFQGPKSWHEIFVSLSILTLTPDLMFNCFCSWPVPKYRLFCSLDLFGPCTFPFLRKSIILFRFTMHYTQDFSSVKELRPLEGVQAIQEMKVSQMILTRQSVRKLPTKVLYQVACRGAVASLFARVGGREGKC